MITEIKRYETFDGLEFDNFDDAYNHEVSTRNAFKDVFFYNDKGEQIDMVKLMEDRREPELISIIIFGDNDMDTFDMVVKAVYIKTGLDICNLANPCTAYYWDSVEYCYHMFDGNLIPKFVFMRDRLADLSSTAS